MKHPSFHLINHCKTLEQLKQVHAQNITTGLITHYPSLTLTKLLFTFTKLPTPPLISLNYPLSIFNHIPKPSTFSYNTVIRLYTLFSTPFSALNFFAKMRRLLIPLDAYTFPFVLKACTHFNDLLLGKTLHSQVIKFGFGGDLFVCNTLIHFYSNVGCLVDAKLLFEESVEKDVVSYNALINGFIKVGDVSGARKVFDEMLVRDNVSWGTLLTGYAQTNQCNEAIGMFKCMIDLGVKPDNVALVSVLSACAQCGALEEGKRIHNYIQRNGVQCTVFLLTALVDMYAKCGCLSVAREIFYSSSNKNLFTWNAMLVGLSMHGLGELTLEYFSKMLDKGVQPDGVSFLGVLVGCTHVGLVDKARQFFNEMEAVYGVQRELKHYGCMADLLGRAGLIKEAMEMIEGMPMKADVFVWGGLLGGCRIHGNVEVAEIAAQRLMELDPEDGGVYTVMANIYATERRWEDVAKMRKLMNGRKISMNTGSSSIQINGMTHEFIAGDTSRPQSDEIYWVLDGIFWQQFEGLY